MKSLKYIAGGILVLLIAVNFLTLLQKIQQQIPLQSGIPEAHYISPKYPIGKKLLKKTN
ncbi:hypothetical protein FLJC2902T_13050 [Flavobacterium limnosediminis JC2902]|uniref:Uncharacterized protein n=1 Tax=Flavobacterium limnosediminis JC2902 TaxID=1341181 RepID=V6SQJ3_9FLAO|nr:hypothetical protein FLJC2902T_13050 [Flavobacterium limnosediminis JC2902]